MVKQAWVLVLATSFLCAVTTGSSVADLRAAPATKTSIGAVTIDITPSHKITTLQPWRAFGSTVDKEPAGSISALYSKRNIRAMLDAGLGWLSYRLYTELSDQDWHWSQAGSFSAGDSGYFTSSASLAQPPISNSFGYRLPHRGNTTDQGNNESYSRLDDGDKTTYWKSDPYLAHTYTGDADDQHPQWVVVDLGEPRVVNFVSISWANPYATDYAIEYWVGDDPIGDPGTGTWVKPFEHGGRAPYLRGLGLGPNDFLKIGPLKARFFRVVMSRSSNTCDTHGAADKRDCVGYAIGELSIGFMRTIANGVVDGFSFHDYVVHRPCGGIDPVNPTCGARQTVTYVSSVDPWHSAGDRVRNQEQPGLDLIARSGLTRGLPAMYPVPMLYSTPENAVAELRYLHERGYPIGYVELGEEPDGQFVSPEDDAALYVQWARAIHRVFPREKLGGPVFSGVDSDLLVWPDPRGNVSWLNRFLAYLESHHAMNELSFMSFEHYPTDNGCVHGAELQRDLLREPSIVKGIVNAWRSDGVPTAVPLYITEANFSSVNYTQAPMQIEGALWQADYMASALANGVAGAVYYQYEPVPLSQNLGCPADWGNLTMFVADARAHIRARGAQFFAIKMLTQQWAQPGDRPHDLYPASTDIRQAGYPLVTAYALRRPDGVWSVMLVNKDFTAHRVSVAFDDASSGHHTFGPGVTRVSFGRAQYVWRARGANSHPDPDGPPETVRLAGGLGATYAIPARSITVLRGSLGPATAPVAQ